MQNLYMMATQIREQQMREMAIEITTGKISIEQAMLQYNVATTAAVMQKIENLKHENQEQYRSNPQENRRVNVQAA